MILLADFRCFLAEASFDLECSYYLMQGEYYKQSLQILRNVLEVTLLQAYFALNYLDDKGLGNAMQQKHPSLKELIVNLRKYNLLSDKMEQQYFKLYKELNSAVHSEVSNLTVYHNFSCKISFSKWYNTFI